jgi:hypothetical protein
VATPNCPSSSSNCSPSSLKTSEWILANGVARAAGPAHPLDVTLLRAGMPLVSLSQPQVSKIPQCISSGSRRFVIGLYAAPESFFDVYIWEVGPSLIGDRQ